MGGMATNLQPIPPVACQVRPVRTRSDLKHFKRLDRWILKRQGGWVEPLKITQNSLLDRRRHPFYDGGRGAEAEFFLARGPDGQPVGRIAAIINHRYAAHAHQNDAPRGMSGFFDCINSQEVARTLIKAAEDWLRRRGATQMLGPASPSETYQYGLLVEGYDQPHRFCLSYNPPYYAELLESSGLRKAKDLLGMSLDMQSPEGHEILERFLDFVDATDARGSGNITIRSPNIRNFNAEVRTIRGLFNQVLSGLWGHSPISEQELGHMFRSLRRFLLPDALLIAERAGEPVGVALAVPDLNEIIRRLKFRMSLVEPIELLFRARRWRPECMRVLVLGVGPGYERSLVVPALVGRLGRYLRDEGIRYVDAHLVLEDNNSILVPLLRYGFRRDRRYRIYRRDLSAPGDFLRSKG